MSNFKFSEKQINEIRQLRYSAPFQGVGGVTMTLEEVKEPLKRGDKVKFKSINSEWRFGWYESTFETYDDNTCHCTYTLEGSRANWSFCEAYDWTDADLMPASLKEGE